MSGEPLVSVIVVTYNSAREIEACLRSVRERTGVAVETIVVDNASSDGTLARVRACDPGARPIANADNAGFSRANNQGLAIARGRYVLYLNPDTELQAGALETLVAVLERDRGCAAVGPRLINPDGRVWKVSARRLPTLWTEFCQLTALDRAFPASSIFARKYYAPWNREHDRAVECLVGAAILLRREDAARLGGFDESVPLFLDDMDLCRRLGATGSIRYVHEAVVLHHHDASSSQQPRPTIERMSLQAVYRYFQKHRGALVARAYALLVGILGVAALGFAAVLRLGGRRREAALAARRGRTLFGWAVGSKAGPWTLSADASSDRARDHLLAPHIG